MTARPLVVVLAPLPPSATGNGLAMRIDLLVQAAHRHHDVVVVVVPVAGSLPDPRPSVAVPTVVLPIPSAGDRGPLVEWLGAPRWRHLVDELVPLPDAVALASPVRTARVAGEAVSAMAGDRPVSGVLAARLTMAPAALVLAAEAGAALVVDADDDDTGLARQLGQVATADAWQRLARATLPSADEVWAAGAADAQALSRRHRVPVAVVPNAAPVVVPLPAPVGGRQLLVVGNLTYGPNEDGVGWLVDHVLPRLPGWRVTLVGPASERVRSLAGARVEVTGRVPEVRPCYEGATVVAVPLRHGAGTRIKVLEAFAVGRPVVATAAGAAGLAVEAGTHLLLADDPERFAVAVEEAAEPARGASLAEAALDLVRQTYDAARITAEAGERLRRATAGRPVPSGRPT